MAKNKSEKCYVGTILFDGEDEIDSDSSSSSFRERLPRPRPNATDNNISDEQQLILEKIQQVEQNTIMSATRSVNLLIETEDIGIQAANELVQQGEQLQNVNNKLDEISGNLTKSKKNLNGIKSVFGNIKNYVKGKDKPKSRDASPSPCNSKMSPKLRASRFYTPIEVPQNTALVSNPHPFSRLRRLDIQTSSSDTLQDINKILDESLNGMVQHVNRLKVLGQDLGKEIDHQNELIDVIHSKVEANEAKIGHQNKQMNKILGN